MKIVFMSLRPAKRASVRVASVCMLALLSFLPAAGIAQQQMARISTSVSSLPDAPLPQDEGQMQNNGAAGDPAGTATISGTVLDLTGAVVRDAQVSLTLLSGSRLRTVKSGANGEFSFAGIPAGSYAVTVEAAGFMRFATKEFTIAAQQFYFAPEIALTVAGATTSIEVRPTEVIAAEQIRAQEKQRFVGVFPNFYVSYVSDPAPLTSRQKLSLATHDTMDWTSFAGVSFGAGLEQASNRYPEYGQGAAGYGKRWAALFVDGRTSDLLGHYVFASLLHQDPRYFYQGTGTKKSRLYHAVGSAFVARSDSGKIMPNYSYLLGDLCSGAIANAYYPAANRGADLVFINAAIGIGGRAGGAVFQEFLGKRLTKNVPDSGASEKRN
jgi:hypothetical protein